ncbi:MAG: hypothetical protein OEZ23_04250, partial [Gammaproteobacteria bacterium]|nr:hypothetical protein [Gammaproteobacteria bacterium]
MKTRKNKSQTALINGILMSLCCLLSTQSLAADTDHDFKVAFSVVSNDNVYKMPDKAISGVSVEAGVGSLLDLSYDFTNEYQTKGDFFIAVDLSSEMYGSDGDADETVLSFKTGSANGYSLAGDNRIKTKAGVFYDRKDKTYVSRFTGLVPVSGGQELNDRFSYTQYGVFGNLDYYMGKATRVSLDIEYKTKDYAEDYVDIGRTNFDYSQWKIKPMIRHQINRELRVGFSLPLAFREYDDRSAQDLLGADIIPSDLEYDYKGLDLSLEYEPARNLSMEIGYKIQNRE